MGLIKGWSGHPSIQTKITNTTIITDSVTGGKALKIFGSKWFFGSHRIPVELDRKYRVRFRVKAEGAPSRVYAGVATYDENGNLETTAPGTHRYCAVVGYLVSPDGNWHVYEGIITGGGNSSHNQFRTTTKFAAPVAVVSYQTSESVYAIVDELSFEDVTESLTAKGHADAAFQSSQTATAKATEAGSHATTAATESQKAVTEAAKAKTEADKSAVSATSAAGSAAVATEKSGIATTAASAAQAQASASAASATTSTSKAEEAAQSAALSTSEKVAAQTARAGAETALTAVNVAKESVNQSEATIGTLKEETVRAVGAAGSYVSGNLLSPETDAENWVSYYTDADTNSGMFSPKEMWVADVDGQGTPGFTRTGAGWNWDYDTRSQLIYPDHKYRFTIELRRNGLVGPCYFIWEKDGEKPKYNNQSAPVPADDNRWYEVTVELTGAVILAITGDANTPARMNLGFSLSHISPATANVGTISRRNYRVE